MKNLFATLAWGVLCLSCGSTPEAEWVSTTRIAPWVKETAVMPATDSSEADVLIHPARTAQVIEGFGTCFNELGWTSLNKLTLQMRESILKELFAPNTGANFTICRMPIGANDFSIDWYSYNETEGDFAMENFSIAHDRQTLIPFIKAARNYLPELRIWASPWCPPSWMKYCKNYTNRTGNSQESLPGEGTDMFIQEEAYLKAYALYFGKFIDAYKSEGIDLFAVMPQNEFNSAQIFPSCCWTARGLARFIGQYLGPEMEKRGVELLFGTMERANEALVDTILTDPASGKYIRGVGFQWAGKGAIAGIHQRYPEMKLYQTEQECGDGKNNWEGAFYAWNLMKHYLNHGASVYTYWNTSLLQGGISHWGWAQNSLVVVDEKKQSFTYTPEYYVMKHVSHFVKPGARKLEVEGACAEEVLAFRNPEGSIVIVAANETAADKTMRFRIEKNVYPARLKAGSINTLCIR